MSQKWFLKMFYSPIGKPRFMGKTNSTKINQFLKGSSDNEKFSASLRCTNPLLYVFHDGQTFLEFHNDDIVKTVPKEFFFELLIFTRGSTDMETGMEM